MVHVRIDVPVHPTEDPEKVASAVRAIFPGAEVEHTGHGITATATSIDTLLKKASEERVNDAARGALWRGRIDDRSTRFEINKQAASSGRVNFNEVSHPLGDLVVTVETDDLNALLDRISPPTGAEIRAQEGHAAKRAAMHREEAEMEELGSDIDTWIDDVPEKPIDEDRWQGDDADWEGDDYDPLRRRRGKDEEE